jgi:multimeric flavodoxin WrbA/protein-tyrosine-phosphatase
MEENMFILGLQGSPRKKGNTDILLSAFMDTARENGAETCIIDVYKQKINPCIECSICEKKGLCSIQDEMSQKIYPLLRRADIVVLASPIFFYNVTAPLKALIDRTQTFWSRKYRLNMEDPRRKIRKGFLLAIGATKGKTLFQGTIATAKYFFDAIGATRLGELTYPQIEDPGAINMHPTAISDAREKALEVVSPFLQRKKILFACKENACRSQMAAAFAHYYAGDIIEATCGGTQPIESVHPQMIQVMMEKGIDMGFVTPQTIEKAVEYVQPDIVVTMGCNENDIEKAVEYVQPDIVVTMGCNENDCAFVPDARRIDWNIDDPSDKPIEVMRAVRDEILQHVQGLANTIKQ